MKSEKLCVYSLPSKTPQYVYSFLSETLHARRVSGLPSRTHTTVSSFQIQMLGLSLLLVDLGLDMEGMPSEMLVGPPLSMLLALELSLLN